MAAVELAQSRSSPMYKSSSVLVLSTQYSSSKSSSSQSSPLLRPRHKSESGTAGRLQMSKVESCLSEHGKRRRTLPKMTKVSTHLCPVDSTILMTMITTRSYELGHEISNNVVCATSKASDQPAHTCIFKTEPGKLDIKRHEPGILFISLPIVSLFKISIMTWEGSGSVVECLTQDRKAMGSSLTGVTALWSLSKTHSS